MNQFAVRGSGVGLRCGVCSAGCSLLQRSQCGALSTLSRFLKIPSRFRYLRESGVSGNAISISDESTQLRPTTLTTHNTNQAPWRVSRLGPARTTVQRIGRNLHTQCADQQRCLEPHYPSRAPNPNQTRSLTRVYLLCQHAELPRDFFVATLEASTKKEPRVRSPARASPASRMPPSPSPLSSTQPVRGATGASVEP